MPRKARIPVVFDTNVIVGRFLTRRELSTNLRLYNLWSIERRLQLIVSPPLIDEYLDALKRVTVEERLVNTFRARLKTSPTVTRINLGKRFELSRDPDDDLRLPQLTLDARAISSRTIAICLRYQQKNVAVLDLLSPSLPICWTC